MELSARTGAETELTVPSPGSGRARPETIHVILTVEDRGSPSLVAYRRAIVTVR